MAALIPLEVEPGVVIYAEVSESARPLGASAIQEASAADVAERALETAENLSATVRAFCSRMVASLLELKDKTRPTRATIEFGLNLSLEGNVFLAKGSAEAAIQVTAEYDFEPARTTPRQVAAPEPPGHEQLR